MAGPKQTMPTAEHKAPAAISRPRSSRFTEASMNSTSSIHALPDEFWKGLDMETLIRAFNEESTTSVVMHTSSQASSSRKPSASDSTSASVAASGPASGTATASTEHVTTGVAPVVAPSEGAFGRLWRPISTFFNGAGATISALGKRKAGNENAEAKATHKSESADKDKPAEKRGYDSKADVEAAYHRAKDLGLLPTPKVFIRPVSRARRNVEPSSPPHTPTATPYLLATPRDPALYKTPSKKDERKQRKLTKRVSDLESKLAATRRELLAISCPNAPPVPPIPANLPSPPTSHHFFSASETSPHAHVEVSPKPNSSSKIVKKRKASSDNDGEYKPTTTDSEKSLDSERESKRSKSSAPKKMRKASSRLLKKKSNVTKEEVVIMVPDGENVPPIPAIPKGVYGKKALRKIKRFFGIGKY